MPAPVLELIFSAIISLVLIGLGAFCFRRELIERKRMNAWGSLPQADRQYFRWQFYRRTIGSAFLVAAGVAIFIGQGILDWRQNPLWYFWIWIAVLLGLFGIICLAGLDIVSIQRYARRQRHKMDSDRRAMIERQIEDYRAERSRSRIVPPDFDAERN